MAARYGRRDRDSLRPVRWQLRPRRVTALRATMVTLLLTVAAGVLYAGEPTTCSTRPTSDPPAAAIAEQPAAKGRALPAGTVGVPITLAEPAALTVVRPGARVDLLAVPPEPTEPLLVASEVLVLEVLPDAGSGAGALYLALRPTQAQRAVGQPPGSRFAVVIRG